MMFHQEMRLPIDTEFLPSDLDAEEGDAETVDHTIEYLLSTRQTVFQKADSNIASAQKHQKETYDRKHQPQQIAEGTEVLLENTYHKQRKGGKMNPVWLGPYTISRHIGKGLHELKSMEGKVLKAKANINRLKIYKRRVGSSSPSKEDSPSPSHGQQVSTDKTRCLKRLPVLYCIRYINSCMYCRHSGIRSWIKTSRFFNP